MFIHISICIIIIQDLLLPTLFENKAVSSIGAHKNFKAYGKPTNANNPIVVLSMPTSANQVPKVAEVRRRGSPEKKPIGKNINNFFLRHIFNSFSNLLFF